SLLHASKDPISPDPKVAGVDFGSGFLRGEVNLIRNFRSIDDRYLKYSFSRLRDGNRSCFPWLGKFQSRKNEFDRLYSPSVAFVVLTYPLHHSEQRSASWSEQSLRVDLDFSIRVSAR